MKTLCLLIATVLLFGGDLNRASAQGTEFTYQGLLHDGTAPANGIYQIAFRPYDVLTGGSPLMTSIIRLVTVSNGLFTTTMDFGSSFLDGNPRYLQVDVCTNGGAVFTSLTPRQQLTPAPYSIFSAVAGTVPGGSITASKLGVDAVGTLALQSNAVLGNKIANGQVVRNVNGLQDSITLAAGTNTTITPSGNTITIAGSGDWKLGGNTGTTPSINFIGTTDSQPLELRANNQRALRLEPTSSADTVNVIGGSPRNSVAVGKVGATIGGGGTGEYQGNAYTNRVEGDFGTVSGGALNMIFLNADFATIGGGAANIIQADSTFATIPGGRENSAASYGFAAGRRAKANHTGAFVWADSQDANFASSASNQFLIRAGGNVGINKTNPTTALDVNGAITATSFNGNGASVTGLNAANLTGSVPGAALTSVPAGNLTGAILDGRLSSNVALRGGGNALTGNQSISGGSLGIGTLAPSKALEIQGAGDVELGLKSTDLDGHLWTLQGSGNGVPGREQAFQIIDRTAGVSRLLINTNGNVGLGTSNPTSALDVNGTVTASSFNGNGGGLANVNAVTLGGLSSASFWKTGGNAGTTASTHFLGTTDDQALEFRVHGVRALRLEPIEEGISVDSGMVNVVGGSPANFVGAGVRAATIAGGGVVLYAGVGNHMNKVTANYGTIGGGVGNTSSGTTATVAGGFENISSGGEATVGGGAVNTSSGFAATVPGGYRNLAGGLYSFAAGNRAHALHDGSLVWADSTQTEFFSTANDQFSIRARGGVRLSSDTTNLSFGTQTRQMLNLWGTQYGIGVQSDTLYFRCDTTANGGFIWYKGGEHNHNYVNPGAGGTELMHLVSGGLYVNAVMVTSDRNAKENFKPLDSRAVLEKVAAMPISRWNFKRDATTPHIGPMAQDFHAAFGLGPDDKHITTVDADGVALAAIQGLNQKLDGEVTALRAENEDLKRRLEKLEQRFSIHP